MHRSFEWLVYRRSWRSWVIDFWYVQLLHPVSISHIWKGIWTFSSMLWLWLRRNRDFSYMFLLLIHILQGIIWVSMLILALKLNSCSVRVFSCSRTMASIRPSIIFVAFFMIISAASLISYWNFRVNLSVSNNVWLTAVSSVFSVSSCY